MRIPVLLIAGLIALGPAAHAADATSANEAPPAAVEAPPPAPSPASQEGPGPGTKTDVGEAPPVPASAAEAPPVPAQAPAAAPEAPPVPASAAEAPPVPAQAPAAAPEALPVPAPAAAPKAGPPPASSAAPAPSMVPVAKSPTYLSMDFTDVDLPVLIKFMSEQTKKNFIFDDRVQGKITIISPRRVTMEEAYNVFLFVLQAKGFTTVTQGNTIKIVAAREARQDTIQTGFSKGTPSAEFITRLVPLKYLQSAEVVPLLTPLVSKDGMVSAFGSSNTLLLIDSRANIDRIVTILSEVDDEGPPGILRVYPLAYAVATDAAKTLSTIYLEGAPAAPAAARGRGIRPTRGVSVKFLPDARTNSVIVYAGQEIQDDAADLLKKIDVPVSAGTGRINVYYLENADAEEVSKVLASLSKERTGAAPPAPGARSAQPVPATGGAVVAAELEGGVKVTADKATNALIIVASANDYETLVGVIKKLDIRRRQVFVEATIMEIDVGKALDVGVEWRGATEIRGGDGALIGGADYGITGGLNNLLAGLVTGNPFTFSGSGLVAGGLGGSVTLPDGPRLRGRPPGVGGEQQPEHPVGAPPAHAEQQGGGDHRRREHPLHHQHLPRLDEPRQRHQHRRAQGRRHHVADHAPHPRERIREHGHLPGGIGPEAGCLVPGTVGHRGADLDETVREDHGPGEERGHGDPGRDHAGQFHQERVQDPPPRRHPPPGGSLQVHIGAENEDESADHADSPHHPGAGGALETPGGPATDDDRSLRPHPGRGEAGVPRIAEARNAEGGKEAVTGSASPAPSDPVELHPETALLAKIPIGYARRHLLLPCRTPAGEVVLLSGGKPEARDAIDEMRFLAGSTRVVRAPEDEVLARIDA
ncbi:MAG: ral secretion pathway protein, partial [Deltaproteobacteria bacterium]|nr:ral secretion pathway protein [Deltaproteobacteria bacterium]